jgi:hypothetical protein
MVAATAVRSMLQRMSLSLEAATEVTAVNGQNLSNVNDFLQLEDKDIETLYCVICRPGGVNAAGNANPGISVLAMAKANLKRMIYELRHVACCSQPNIWADITLVSTRKLVRQAQMEESTRTLLLSQPLSQRTGPRPLRQLKSTLEDSEVARVTHSHTASARNWPLQQQWIPQLVLSRVCIYL